jgi:hypothetical protein
MKNVEVFDEGLISGYGRSFIVEDNELAYCFSNTFAESIRAALSYLTNFSQPSRSIVSAPIKFRIASLRHHLTPLVFGSPLGLATRGDICN